MSAIICTEADDDICTRKASQKLSKAAGNDGQDMDMIEHEEGSPGYNARAMDLIKENDPERQDSASEDVIASLKQQIRDLTTRENANYEIFRCLRIREERL